MLSKRVKIKLDYNQQVIVETMSNEHRMLYNHLLGSIKNKPLTFKELNESYKNYRNDNQLTISSKSAQNTCIGLINNIKSFYALKKKDKSARFPHTFKNHKYFTSFMFDGMNGLNIKDNKLFITLLSSSIKAKKLIINLPNYISNINENNIKTLTFKKEDNGDYYLIFVYGETKSNLSLNKDNYLSIDLGFSNLINGVTKENNFKIVNFRQKRLDRRIEELQSKKDLKKKRSKKYKKINISFKKNKSKKVNQIKDFQHKTSKKIIDYCIKKDIGTIIIGDLKVKKVISRDNKKINGKSKLTSIGRFKVFLEYKAKNIGIEYKLINEYNTSKMNCITNKLEFDSNLKNREFIFNGIKIDRDFNSCVNILKKSGIWLTQDEAICLLNNKVIEI
jgi:putative transposase